MIIAVDFDGTIVENRYPDIGKEKPFAVDTLKRIQENLHHHLILWTVRNDNLLAEAVEWCRKRGLAFYAVNSNYAEEKDDSRHQSSRKLTADMFIDDRNLGGLPDWGYIYQMLEEKRLFEGFDENDAAARNNKKKSSLARRLFGRT